SAFAGWMACDGHSRFGLTMKPHAVFPTMPTKAGQNVRSLILCNPYLSKPTRMRPFPPAVKLQRTQQRCQRARSRRVAFRFSWSFEPSLTTAYTAKRRGDNGHHRTGAFSRGLRPAAPLSSSGGGGRRSAPGRRGPGGGRERPGATWRLGCVLRKGPLIVQPPDEPVFATTPTALSPRDPRSNPNR